MGNDLFRLLHSSYFSYPNRPNLQLHEPIQTIKFTCSYMDPLALYPTHEIPNTNRTDT